MCRYGLSGPYKPHFACFGCRKAFKRRRLEDVNPGGTARDATCPECGERMADMGLDFAPPKRDDLKAWATLAELWEIGETFHGCGCGGPGYRPRTPAALAGHLRKIHRDFSAMVREAEAGRLYPGRVVSGPEERDGRVAYWRGRVGAVEAMMREKGMDVDQVVGARRSARQASR